MIRDPILFLESPSEEYLLLFLPTRRNTRFLEKEMVLNMRWNIYYLFRRVIIK